MRFITVISMLITLALAQGAGKAPDWAKPPVKPVPKKDQVCFAMYTVHHRILKMTAFLYPLADGDSRTVRLEVRNGTKWTKIAQAKVRENEYGSPKGAKAWNVPFRVENWDSTKDYAYRVSALDGVATFEGTIRKDPGQKDEVVVAAFTGNSFFDRHLRTDIIQAVNAINPDLLFFSGDQVYNHTDHMSSWLIFGRQFRDIIRHRPTICIPDDHDVGHGNLWGAGGKKSNRRDGADGGYKMPVSYVKEVEFAQTANLPDPYDPTPIQRGIGVYYTSYNLGGIDFAIIEDRKFKTGPFGKIPGHKGRPDHITQKIDPKLLDTKDAILLGERQLKFLNDWTQQWNGVQMKCVLSATIFAGAATNHGGVNGWMMADLDSNGWPPRGRNRALRAIRKGYAFMIGGDQHLATVVHHGIDDFEDAGYSFCVPSIVNHYGRWWLPRVKPQRRIPTPLEHTGDYLDGFGNHMSMYAYANPGEYELPPCIQGKYPRRATGYGIVRFNKKTRKIRIECWPRGVDPTKPKAKQFPGWPITIDQEDNYARKAVAYLPTIRVNTPDPVVQVIDESTNEVVYTIRIKGTTWRPKVFSKGAHTVRIGEGKNVKILRGLTPSDSVIDVILAAR